MHSMPVSGLRKQHSSFRPDDSKTFKFMFTHIFGMRFASVHLAFHPCSPDGRDLRSATNPFDGISVSLQQAAEYSGQGE